jgi:hypothetical protein
MTADLMDRLRAADPAADQPDALPDRAKLIAARRRRVSRRATGGAAATIATALAIALAPFGGGGTPGAPTSVLAAAAEAAKLPPGSIVVTTSDVKVRTSEGTMNQRRTTWVQVGGSGKVLASRMRNTQDGKVTSDDATRGSGTDAVHQALDPTTGRIRTERGTWQSPGLLFQAQALLRTAQRDGTVKPTTFEDRPAHSIVVTGAEEEPLPGDRDELIVDAETFAPLVLRKHSEGIAVDGKPFTYDYTERVIEQETLPDTPEHRAALTLR